MFYNDNINIVIGDRTLTDSITVKGYNWIRVMSGRIFSVLIKFILFLPYPDTQCGFKAIRKQTMQSILKPSIIDTFTFDVELLYALYLNNIFAERIPVIFFHSDRSSINLLYDPFIMFLDLIRIRTHKKFYTM